MPRKIPSSWCPNVLVSVIIALAAGLLYGSFDPVPAGAAPEVARTEQPAPLFEVPLPSDTVALVASRGG